MGCERAAGHEGEQAAERYLARRGWRILARNWRGPGAELDLVALRGGLLAIIEVKARSRGAALAEPVTAAQQARIERGARAFLAARPELASGAVRFDLLTVWRGHGRSRVRHVPGAFEASREGRASRRWRSG
jgi:putative endonuclease